MLNLAQAKRSLAALVCAAAVIAAVGRADSASAPPRAPFVPFGVYYTEYGPLDLQRAGHFIVGRYPHEEGVVEGELRGTTLDGRWRQSDGSGRFVAEFAADFSSFAARYDHDDDRWARDWHGMRRVEALARRYKTSWGTLSCEIEGRQMECLYPWFNGRLSGDLDGSTFRGTWSQANGGGRIELNFASDFASFSGRYCDFQDSTPVWSAWNGAAAP